MAKIQQLLDAGFPIIPKESDEFKGQYSYGKTTPEQDTIFRNTIKPPSDSKYKGRKPKDLTPDGRNEILFGHLLDENGNIK